MTPIDELITPFKLVLERSAFEVRATSVSIQAIDLPHRLRARLKNFKALLPEGEGHQLLANAIDIMATWADSFPQPTADDAGEYLRLFAGRNLVFHWSQIEAMVDDSTHKMILLDQDVESKLISAGVKKIPNRQECTEAEWAKKIEKKLKDLPKFHEVRNSTVRKHAFMFEVLGAQFMLDPQYWNSIDEIDSLRNVLLHNNGVVDDLAKTKAPRLSKYIGSVVPFTDPIFTVCSALLNDYVFRLLMTLMSLPYVNGIEQNSFLRAQVTEMKVKRENS
jgi:hypothetical protein